MPEVILTTPNLDISYKESVRQAVSIRPEGWDITRYVLLAGADEPSAAAAFLGWSEYDDVNQWLRRFPPDHHPRWPGAVARTFEYGREVGAPGATGPEDSLVFAETEWAVNYQAGTEDLAGVLFLPDADRPEGVHHEAWRYTRARVEYEVSSIPLPKTRIKFYDNNDPVPEPGVQMQQEFTLYVTLLDVPAVLVNGALDYVGALRRNIDACVLHTNEVGIFGFAPKTLLPVQPKRRLRTMANGEPCFDVSYTFLGRGGVDVSDVGLLSTGTSVPSWDRLIRPNGKYYTVYRFLEGTPADKTQRVYPTIPLEWMFRFDAIPADVFSLP